MDGAFVKIECPSCRCKKYDPFIRTFDRFDKSQHLNFQLVKCQRCGLIYLNPRPLENDIWKYYNSEGYDPFISIADRKSFREKIYVIIRKFNIRRKASRINCVVDPGRLLDVGCATGEFLSAMKKKRWNVFGIETDEKSRNFSINRGYNVFESLDSIDEGCKFDLITFWHVLEHVYRLKESLEKVYELLSHDGYLVIAVPNILSIDFRQYRKYWVALDAPRHLYHFSPVTLIKLLETSGFRFVHSWPLIVDSFYNYLMCRQLKYSRFRGWGNMFIYLLYSLLRIRLSSQKYASSLVYYFIKRS